MTRMLRFAILNGLRDDLKSHVTRAQPATWKDLQEAAKIAELCPTEKPRSNDTLAIQLALMQDQLKQVLSNQNTGATKSAPVNQSEDKRPRSPSPKRVQFEDDRSPSRTSRDEDYRYDRPQSPRRFQGRRYGAYRGNNYREGGNRSFSAQRRDEQNGHNEPFHRGQARGGFRGRGRGQPPYGYQSSGQQQTDGYETCFKCGCYRHSHPNDCTAINQICHGCGKKNHFRRVCRGVNRGQAASQ